MSIKNNIEKFTQTLPKGCRLIAVSKTQPVEKILEAYEAGQRLFGENKIQELTAKYESLPNDIEWHMIGHVQSNKVKYMAPFVHLIHSVDSLKLLAEIDRQAKKVNRTISCLLQIHIATEETKFGFSESEVLETLQSDQFKSLANVRILGLMGMATLTDDQAQIRKEFKSLKTLFEKIKSLRIPNVAMQELSMGMSSDYKIAIEEGSTFIRVGTAIFGERNYP
ncbi:MAG TPA: YggS family pyridoxal phosphate-dependent enzyme [Cyclobacteriaceae bacterium]|nr:YggS family pyridoxal phosphate-dependent enzyme [Cyclobacteriaceae bacterium]HMV08704.1 YggS family pyridoxal phosphate-dependent enzyme [Cyclobacteriaceae bacterium]HMV90859.1 YggS family pyridoxal phosphate-dependent enzyme [Cyclobacteriaceae bacterium]HMX00087.1 YggS family pyridoxal phosphate-dependent enzyme [Cyclobacteriaceae bacterium]HMX49051.1 YggS family pyridoxal phosphate-dependent enzyme [Cyclobacteriaceae bacterium]